jgi:VWFA-related protein
LTLEPGDGRAVLLFFDDVHVTAPGAARVRDSLSRFLIREIRPGDAVSVVAPQSGFWWTARTEAEHAQLPMVLEQLEGQYVPDPHGTGRSDWEAMAEVEGATTGVRGEEASGGPPLGAPSALLKQRSARMVRLDSEAQYASALRRIRMTLAGLRRAVESLQGMGGRKSIVLVSEGFVLPPTLPEYARIVDLCSRANVAIYVADPRGLVSGLADASSPTEHSGGSALPASGLSAGAAGASHLALATGGQAFSSNDASDAIARVFEESSSYYLIGFQPASGRDGERELRVGVKRDGLRVRARSRYYYGAPIAPGMEPDAPAVRALRALSDAADVPLRVAVAPPSGTGGGTRVELTLDPAQDARERHLKLAIEARPLAGGEPVRDVAVLTVPPADALLPVARELQLAQGTWQIRVVVHDTDTDAIGSAQQTLAVAETAAPAAPPVPAELAPVLERAGLYVARYEEAFQGLVAEEQYDQLVKAADARGTATAVEGSAPAAPVSIHCDYSNCRRRTKADVVFVKLPGAVPWGAFRDVFEVDGVGVRDREPRLEQAFASLPPARAEQRARALREDSDKRYSIGTSLRAINVPTLALAFLLPQNQARFAWKQSGTRRLRDTATVELAFEETARPTIGRVGEADLPARGRLWVDPSRGTVLRSETEFTLGPTASASLATEYRPEPGLDLWVPAEMREQYVVRSRPGEQRTVRDTRCERDYNRLGMSAAGVCASAPESDECRMAQSAAERTCEVTASRREGGGQPGVFGVVATNATARYSNYRRVSRAIERVVESPGPAAPEATLPSSPDELSAVLLRVGEYVEDFQRRFRDLVTEEVYTQHVKSALLGSGTFRPGRKRTTRAELVFVRLAGEIPWASYRDVFEVDGRKVRERDDALVRLMSEPQTDAAELSRTLLTASAAYNIGPVSRTVNLPTLALVFLLPRNQPRFGFRLGERRTIASTETVELLFGETSRPTFVNGPNASELPAAGRFWVSPARGTVVRSEVSFDFGPGVEARVRTDYRPAPELAMWVPAEMREHYADTRAARLRVFLSPFEGTARYVGFRRFTVETQERAVPKE